MGENYRYRGGPSGGREPWHGERHFEPRRGEPARRDPWRSNYRDRGGYAGSERDSSDFGRSAEGSGDYGGYGDDRRWREIGYGEDARDEWRSAADRDDEVGEWHPQSRYAMPRGNVRHGAFYGQRERGYGDFRQGDWQRDRGGSGQYGGPGRRQMLGQRMSPYGDERGGRYAGSRYPQQYGGSAFGSRSQYSSGSYGGRYYGGGVRGQSQRGRGPKGYQRSDERLQEIVCERLTDDPNIDASEISVEVTGQVVRLTGTVYDRTTKYQVEDLVEQCGGVKDIDNQLRVQSSSWTGDMQVSKEDSGYYGDTTRDSASAKSTLGSTAPGSSGSSASKRNG